MNDKNYFQIFEEFVKFLEDNNMFLKKICGNCHTSLGLKLIQIFSNNEDCMDRVKNFMENHSTRLELGEHGYVDLSELDGLDRDDMLTWFSKFILEDGKTVGKGEVLLSILFNNVFKTPLNENSDGEPGDLFLSDDSGKTPIGRIEVKTALPSGFKFSEKIRINELEKIDGGERLVNAYKNYVNSSLNSFVMDKDLFIELCVYCIATYMHRQYPKEENYYFVIFDNQPHVNKHGNIHGTNDKKIKKIIDYDGFINSFDNNDEQIYKSDIRIGDENDEIPFWRPDEDELSDSPTKSENGNEKMSVKDFNGFLYIKRCSTVGETMERIMSFVDKDSSIYKENKNNSQNNFTFYVKDRKICIAHKDNPPLAKNTNRRK